MTFKVFRPDATKHLKDTKDFLYANEMASTLAEAPMLGKQKSGNAGRYASAASRRAERKTETVAVKNGRITNDCWMRRYRRTELGAKSLVG